jgi:phage tail protein X
MSKKPGKQGMGILLMASLLAGACREDVSALSEESDKSYQTALILKTGDRDKKTRALQEFLKVVENHRAAPNSHLEVGLLYLDQDVGDPDPISAIYHFKKYLEFLPDAESEKGKRVKAQIVRAEKLFMRSLPGDPYDDSVLNNRDLDELIKSLRQENETLRARLKQYSNTSAELSLQEPQQESASPRGISRKYTVAKGDTLFKIASKVYGDHARWREIYEANRHVMSRENDLRIGLELVIP